MSPLGKIASSTVGMESLFWSMQCFVSQRLYDDSKCNSCRTESSGLVQWHVSFCVCACVCVYLLHICVCMCIHKRINVTRSSALEFAPFVWYNDIKNESSQVHCCQSILLFDVSCSKNTPKQIQTFPVRNYVFKACPVSPIYNFRI